MGLKKDLFQALFQLGILSQSWKEDSQESCQLVNADNSIMGKKCKAVLMDEQGKAKSSKTGVGKVERWSAWWWEKEEGKELWVE